MSFKKLIEFQCECDDIEIKFNEIIGEFMNDSYKHINPRIDLDIHYEVVQDFQDAAKVANGIRMARLQHLGEFRVKYGRSSSITTRSSQNKDM